LSPIPRPRRMPNNTA